ncbi:MAG TPA: lysophospholipid acyltransferase family protein [Candidatus Acidoferrales bacterium]|jgi:1-acyl-sn-glycerol-3-phosphate acyltransferase|nr:lysophospholipid acyltransferase family protein [Candidatus Acidoferrales bacterium]
MLRSFIAVTFLALFLILVGPLLILHCLIAGSPEFLYRIAAGATEFALAICGTRVKVDGRENIPPGVCIFVANHTSNADPPVVVAAIPRRVAMLAKKEIFRIPILGTAMKLTGYVPVDRRHRESAIASVDLSLENLKRGVSYLIFPEGTRSPDGRLRPFKKGSFVMAIRAQVPVVPVSVIGAHKIMRKGESAIYPGEVTVKIHPPVQVNSYTVEHRDELIARVQAIVASGLPEDQQPLAPNTECADSSLRSE